MLTFLERIISSAQAEYFSSMCCINHCLINPRKNLTHGVRLLRVVPIKLCGKQVRAHCTFRKDWILFHSDSALRHVSRAGHDGNDSWQFWPIWRVFPHSALTRLALTSVKAQSSFHVSAAVKANLQLCGTFDLVWLMGFIRAIFKDHASPLCLKRFITDSWGKKKRTTVTRRARPMDRLWSANRFRVFHGSPACTAMTASARRILSSGCLPSFQSSSRKKPQEHLEEISASWMPCFASSLLEVKG